MARSEFVPSTYYFPSCVLHAQENTASKARSPGTPPHPTPPPKAVEPQLSSSNQVFSKTDLLCGKSTHYKDFCFYMILLF